jgi:hypothetical protein
MFHISMMLKSKCIMHAILHDGDDHDHVHHDNVCGYYYPKKILVEGDGDDDDDDDGDYAPAASKEGDGDDDDDDDGDGDYAPAA